MLPIIEKLLVLQDRDRRLLRVRAELAAVPGQRLVIQTRAAAGAAEYETLKKQTQQLESDRKKLELDYLQLLIARALELSWPYQSLLSRKSF